MEQDKGANVLPTPSGPVELEAIMQYRSSPKDSGHVPVHGVTNTYPFAQISLQARAISNEPIIAGRKIRAGKICSS